ncbi:MAG: ribosome biogenesis GTP-binding protein YihA/YsxC [Alphaproteobacteria bacterium]|nr:ribosome biogenesis GTP-binding protein YihA/YsxC [Alphaproteobacteria bacterium]
MIDQDLDKARKFFARDCTFVRAVSDPAQFPDAVRPEVAFVGRSNVGKSSLINALTGRKGLARTSNTPGRTQQIIFFDLEQTMMLVDLPGYGYAKTSLVEKKRWEGLIKAYLNKRETLRVVCLLLDGRHEVKDSDLAMMDQLDKAAVLYKLILTKMDQITDAGRAARVGEVDALIAKHPAALAGVLETSAAKKKGLEALRLFLCQQCGVL